MFRVEQRLYALPLNAVAEIARTVEENIHQVEHYDVLQLRNDVLPLLRLGAKPPSGPETARRKVFVLVINSGERKFGVVVDELEGEEELVIKALDDQSITTDLVSGASILGDGRVVLILNMIALMDRFTRGRADATGPRMAGLLSSLAPARVECGDRRHGADAGPRHGRGPVMKKPVRVLVVDDSALMRKLIPKILEQDDSIEVVGTAMDGNFALKKIEDLSPQVVTLDLEMPGLNGIDTLKEIMRRWRLPVIVVSSHSTAGASITLKALALGAFDFVAKPQDVSARMPEIAAELIKKIHAAAQSAGVQPQFLPGETHGASSRASCSPWRRRTSSPSAFPPAVRTPCNTCFRICRRNFPAASWWCSICRTASRNCLPSGWTSAAPSG